MGVTINHHASIVAAQCVVDHARADCIKHITLTPLDRFIAIMVLVIEAMGEFELMARLAAFGRWRLKRQVPWMRGVELDDG